jgi:hypothetical protein
MGSYPGTDLAGTFRTRHPDVTDEELLCRLGAVTNGPEDNACFGLSDVSTSALLDVLGAFRRIETERAPSRAYGDVVSANHTTASPDNWRTECPR